MFITHSNFSFPPHQVQASHHSTILHSATPPTHRTAASRTNLAAPSTPGRHKSKRNATTCLVSVKTDFSPIPWRSLAGMCESARESHKRIRSYHIFSCCKYDIRRVFFIKMGSWKKKWKTFGQPHVHSTQSSKRGKNNQSSAARAVHLSSAFASVSAAEIFHSILAVHPKSGFPTTVGSTTRNGWVVVCEKWRENSQGSSMPLCTTMRLPCIWNVIGD